MDATSAGHSLKVVFGAAGLLILLAVICLKIKNWTPGLQKVLFSLIAAITILSTGYLAFSTVQLNITSSSGGPVHWHADFEIWNCGVEVNLKDPKGWSNKIGTATLHEHSDKRIHLEGVVVERNDASLGKFFQVIGGEINSRFAVFPTNEGPHKLINGRLCPDGRAAEVQVFAYRVQGTNYSQQKLTNPESFIIAPESQVPPGDCIIVEFDSPKDKTDKLCRSFMVAKQIGKLGEEIP